jgi:hypothetical protein
MCYKTGYRLKQGKRVRMCGPLSDVKIKSIRCKHIKNCDKDKGNIYNNIDNTDYQKQWQNP